MTIKELKTIINDFNDNSNLFMENGKPVKYIVAIHDNNNVVLSSTTSLEWI